MISGIRHFEFSVGYKVKKQQSWKAFDFVSMNRYDDNILLMTEIEKALIADGWLVRPVCYFDTTETIVKQFIKPLNFLS